MPQITLDTGDAAELAEMPTFLADWLSGRQKPAPEESLAAFVGHPAYTTDALRADLHRFAFLLSASDGKEEPSGEPRAMSANTGAARSLDRITRITPTLRWLSMESSLRGSGTERPVLVRRRQVAHHRPRPPLTFFSRGLRG